MGEDQCHGGSSPAQRDPCDPGPVQRARRQSRAVHDAGRGPPAGLMSHAVYPDGDGFVIAEVWRAESEGQSYIDDVLRPLLDESGLAGQDTVVRPVWSFARP